MFNAEAGPWCHSPALVDVDVVDFVGQNGCFCQCLDHVVTLQDNISLGGESML